MTALQLSESGRPSSPADHRRERNLKLADVARRIVEHEVSPCSLPRTTGRMKRGGTASLTVMESGPTSLAIRELFDA
jgi:hypothetical protein